MTMKTLSFDVHGMTCGGCTSSVKRALGQLDGVKSVEVTLRPGTAIVQADSDVVTSAQIESAITGLGYQVKVHPANVAKVDAA